MKKFIEWLRSIFPAKPIEIEEDKQAKQESKENISDKELINILSHYNKENE